MKTQTFEVTTLVTVTIDETQFTKEWMQEFRTKFFPFSSIESHMEHLAQAFARGFSIDQIDGYYGMPGITIEAGERWETRPG